MAGSMMEQLKNGFTSLWVGVKKSKQQKGLIKDSVGCGGCTSACRINVSAPEDSQVSVSPRPVATKQEAVDESLRNLLRVLEKPYGADIECIPDKACELVEMGASGAIVDEISAFYLKKGAWQDAWKIVRAAKRNFSESEKAGSFARFIKCGALKDFCEMAEITGFPPKEDIIRAVSYTNLPSGCWEYLYRIVESNPDQDIVDAALDTCCKREYVDMALKITEFPCSLDQKKKVAEVVFSQGSMSGAKDAVKELFGRNELEPQEIMAVSTAMAKIADQKREDHKSSAESED